MHSAPGIVQRQHAYDGAWPGAKIDVFSRWAATGAQP